MDGQGDFGWAEEMEMEVETVAMASQKCQMCCVIYAVSRMICLQSVYFSCLSAEKYEKDKLINFQSGKAAAGAGAGAGTGG